MGFSFSNGRVPTILSMCVCIYICICIRLYIGAELGRDCLSAYQAAFLQSSCWQVSSTNTSNPNRYPAGSALETARARQRFWTTCHVPQPFLSASHRASPSHKQTLTGLHTIYLWFRPTHFPSQRALPRFLFSVSALTNFPFHHAPATKEMVCRRVTPHWVCRVQASPCTPPFPRAREESPSSTARTQIMTCRPRPSHVTPPSQVKGETQGGKQKQWQKWGVFMCLSKEILLEFMLSPVFFIFFWPYIFQAHSRGLHRHTFCSSESVL